MNGWWLVALLWMTSVMTPRVEPHETKTFNVVARRFSYTVTPSPFRVNQGDVVTINFTAADDGVGDGHGFRMQTYMTSSRTAKPGDEPVVIQFTAHTAGEFEFFCTRFCGSGHGGMDGIFTVIGAATPTISEVSPSTGPTSGGTTVAIHGTGFVDGATVKFGTLPAANVEFINETELHAVTPAGPFDFANTQVVDIIVTNPDSATGQKNLAFTWTVPSPSITSLSPSTGTRSGGTLVTIRGGGFSTAVPATVTFGGAFATNVTVVDATTLTARAPAHAAGNVDVAITTTKGSANASSAYRYLSTKRRAMRR
jgi:plastocyanin